MIEALRNRAIAGEDLPMEDLRTLLSNVRRGLKAAQQAPTKSKATAAAKKALKPSSGLGLEGLANEWD